MRVGYARVSTSEQKLNLQEDALKDAGCEEVFTDVVSGVKADRNGFNELIKFIRPGDTLVVWKLDRLGRSVKHLIETVNELQKRGISFMSIQESIDTSTSGGKLIFHIFGALAEFERDLISERTQAGMKAARARGKLGGRRAILDDRKVKRMIELYDERKTTVTEICKIFSISRPAFYVYRDRFLAANPSKSL
jgi:DNA invertase Pin-like site-specific DNA recombinase